ncbi:MAG: acyltransferase [Candidatus Delongbacteria bacterium]|nr:acyltransferase [Candidatus Delongbacteria bacterium]
MNSFYTQKELHSLGFKSIGDSVLISRNAKFYSPEKMVIGSHVRIDDYCILSGSIVLGSYIHISAYSVLYGSKGIEMEDYSGISARCTIYSATDDFSGDFLIGPMVDEQYTNVIGGKVVIKRFSQLGVGCVVFPNVIIEEGVAVGAMSLVNKSLLDWSIYAGVPVVKIKDRSKKLLNFLKNE